jgi:ABC-type glycerol-3-phosphate transport system permease component
MFGSVWPSPDELVEAGHMDGVAAMTMCLHIVMPACKPSFVAAAITLFFAWATSTFRLTERYFCRSTYFARLASDEAMPTS